MKAKRVFILVTCCFIAYIMDKPLFENKELKENKEKFLNKFD